MLLEDTLLHSNCKLPKQEMTEQVRIKKTGLFPGVRRNLAFWERKTCDTENKNQLGNNCKF